MSQKWTFIAYFVSLQRIFKTISHFFNLNLKTSSINNKVQKGKIR